MTIIIMETFMGHDCDAPTDKRVVRRALNSVFIL
jgi:hypothetical protein